MRHLYRALFRVRAFCYNRGMDSTNTSDKPRTGGFGWLNATQFFGALNDNLFKMFEQMFLMALFPGAKERLLSLATVLFALPFLFFTAYAGFLADRFNKRRVTVALKYAELGVMALAAPAFLVGRPEPLFALLFLMSLQSTLFSPTKYGIVPELVGEADLPRANSLLTSASFLAIIAGSALAPLVASGAAALFPERPNLAYALVQALCVAVAGAGVLTSVRIRPLAPANPAARPDLLFFRQLWRTSRWVRKDRPLFYGLLGSMLFTTVAAFLQINLPCYGIDRLGLNERTGSFLFFFAAVGIAAGALLAGRLSRRNIEFGVMPLGALSVVVSVFALGLFPKGMPAAVSGFFIFAAGFGAGLFVVPLDTFLQLRLPEDRRGEGLALNSFLSWLGVLLSGVLLAVFRSLGAGASGNFLLIGIPALAMFVVSLVALKEFSLRFFVNRLVGLFYRVRTEGIENLPVSGPALLVANHASYMDALLLSATTRRRIRFLISKDIYDGWRFLLPVFRTYGAIPVKASSPRSIVSAIREARRALDDGFVVCVFAEGGITRTGAVRAFKHGFEKIPRGRDVPVVPVYLGGSWGAFFHYYRGQFVRQRVKSLFGRYPVTVMFGKPLPAETPAAKVRRAVTELSCGYFESRKAEHGSLGRAFLAAARRGGSGEAVADTTGRHLSWRELRGAARTLADRVAPASGGSAASSVGVALPPGVPAVVAHAAAALLERCAVEVPPAAGAEDVALLRNASGYSVLMTGRDVLEKNPALAGDGVRVVFVEDSLDGAAAPAPRGRREGVRRARDWWRSAVRRRADPDAPAAMYLPEAPAPEGRGPVTVTRHEVLSMVESLHMVLAPDREDRLCGTLPFGGAFGLVAALWHPLLRNGRVVYHADPADARTVAGVLRAQRATLFFCRLEDLERLSREASPGDFRSLRLLLVLGRLDETFAREFEGRFGIRPLSVYAKPGIPAPLAISVQHATGGGITHEGWREGRVGFALPGIALKVVDPETDEERGPGERGALRAKGAGVPAAGPDGWAATGDTAFVDEDGFVAVE